MSEVITPEQRRYMNRLRHLQQRQEANQARGPRGVAASWWDHARAIATRAERDGNPELWDHLARALENWCRQVDQPATQQHGQ
ncbi:hypothetical protein [Streptomyces pseudogriseolus]|uniref:hypothetical protein n=1 Tax=Streptomyces pseudogriseolus TaxID=36817 RepID=UPI003FA2223D